MTKISFGQKYTFLTLINARVGRKNRDKLLLGYLKSFSWISKFSFCEKFTFFPNFVQNFPRKKWERGTVSSRDFLLKIDNIYQQVGGPIPRHDFSGLRDTPGIFRQTGLWVQFGHRSGGSGYTNEKIKYEYIRLNISGSVSILTKIDQNKGLF